MPSLVTLAVVGVAGGGDAVVGERVDVVGTPGAGVGCGRPGAHVGLAVLDQHRHCHTAGRVHGLQFQSLVLGLALALVAAVLEPDLDLMKVL